MKEATLLVKKVWRQYLAGPVHLSLLRWWCGRLVVRSNPESAWLGAEKRCLGGQDEGEWRWSGGFAGFTGVHLG